MAELDPRWAWQPYKPSAESPWDIRKVGHLYRRAGFGATWEELEAGLKTGPEKAIDQLLQSGPGQDKADPVAEILATEATKSNNDQYARAWWLYRMLYTSHPLREKLTLFWHNHFATSNSKVRSAKLMFEQNVTLRRHALSKFRPFLLDMSKDTAMLIWLDSNDNTRRAPNENYAREVMELFS